MTDLEHDILSCLAFCPGVMNTTEIAEIVERPWGEVQAALHRLDDSGAVLMRCGLYRASEATRAAWIEARQHTRTG
jgi:predicted transcriptional regulator